MDDRTTHVASSIWTVYRDRERAACCVFAGVGVMNINEVRYLDNYEAKWYYCQAVPGSFAWMDFKRLFAPPQQALNFRFTGLVISSMRIS